MNAEKFICYFLQKINLQIENESNYIQNMIKIKYWKHKFNLKLWNFNFLSKYKILTKNPQNLEKNNR